MKDWGKGYRWDEELGSRSALRKISAPNGNEDQDADRDQSSSKNGGRGQLSHRLHPHFFALGDILVPVPASSSPIGEKFSSPLLSYTLTGLFCIICVSLDLYCMDLLNSNFGRILNFDENLLALCNYGPWSLQEFFA